MIFFKIRAREENALLESTLQEQVEKMKSIHNQLDTLRDHKREEDAWELAEEHFSKSRIILRNALRRFRNSIQYQIRLRVIFVVLQNIYHLYLRNK